MKFITSSNHGIEVTNTVYVGCAITAVIAVKFGTAHGRSQPEVGSAKCIVAKRGFPGSPEFSVLLTRKIILPTILLRRKLNFFSLTVCRLNQYLLHSRKKSGDVP